ncbi:hypothetical protein MDA_GLEAN10009456 [Myotis davidii]|uniref:Uncharacterized protein n=1 Tax=Myotis davidii TaxID=225400 RepID=L5LEU3_MYODS|nr:hypothetical protein MDA_GLEAN10009456 [Myotis davidii]
MVEQVSGGAKPKQGASRCHRDEPLVVTENSLLPCAVVLPSAQPAASTGPTHTRCQRPEPPLALPVLAPIAQHHKRV